jgi:4-carboxymuconolactone decarboxylase
MPTAKEIEQAHKTLFDAGIAIRREVAGSDYVDASLKRFSSDFSKPLQSSLTEIGWGWIWSRPGLTRKQRSLLNLGMLCALNRSIELGVHVRGALNNGLSEVEIREALLQVGVYCGLVSSILPLRRYTFLTNVLTRDSLPPWRLSGLPKRSSTNTRKTRSPRLSSKTTTPIMEMECIQKFIPSSSALTISPLMTFTCLLTFGTMTHSHGIGTEKKLSTVSCVGSIERLRPLQHP